MKKMSIYEPAMCCPTGLCGVGVDPELLRISTALNSLKKSDIVVERYNLTNSPQKFLTNKEINRLLEKEGTKILPITVVDDRIVITGRYPRNDEIAGFLGIDSNMLGEEKKASSRYKVSGRSGGCGCKGGCC
jgi:hypothetical protein